MWTARSFFGNCAPSFFNKTSHPVALPNGLKPTLKTVDCKELLPKSLTDIRIIDAWYWSAKPLHEQPSLFEKFKSIPREFSTIVRDYLGLLPISEANYSKSAKSKQEKTKQQYKNDKKVLHEFCLLVDAKKNSSGNEGEARQVIIKGLFNEAGEVIDYNMQWFKPEARVSDKKIRVIYKTLDNVNFSALNTENTEKLLSEEGIKIVLALFKQDLKSKLDVINEKVDTINAADNDSERKEMIVGLMEYVQAHVSLREINHEGIGKPKKGEPTLYQQIRVIQSVLRDCHAVFSLIKPKDVDAMVKYLNELQSVETAAQSVKYFSLYKAREYLVDQGKLDAQTVLDEIPQKHAEALEHMFDSGFIKKCEDLVSPIKPGERLRQLFVTLAKMYQYAAENNLTLNANCHDELQGQQVGQAYNMMHLNILLRAIMAKQSIETMNTVYMALNADPEFISCFKFCETSLTTPEEVLGHFSDGPYSEEEAFSDQTQAAILATKQLFRDTVTDMFKIPHLRGKTFIERQKAPLSDASKAAWINMALTSMQTQTSESEPKTYHKALVSLHESIKGAATKEDWASCLRRAVNLGIEYLDLKDFKHVDAFLNAEAKQNFSKPNLSNLREADLRALQEASQELGADKLQVTLPKAVNIKMAHSGESASSESASSWFSVSLFGRRTSGGRVGLDKMLLGRPPEPAHKPAARLSRNASY